MSNNGFKKQLVDVGDQLALILSKDKESFALYKMAKKLYIINQQLLEYSDDYPNTDNGVGVINDEYPQSIADNRWVELENTVTGLTHEVNELRQSVNALAATVFDHDKLLKPINDLLKKHGAYIEAIKKKMSIS